MVTVIGAGLAGSEAAWQLARRGVRVRLFEMRPDKLTPAHRTGLFGELVCSNSLKSRDPLSAQGLLKEELRMLGSLVMEAAESAQLPGGKALVVDREKFARYITERLEAHPLVEVVREEVREIPPEGIVIVAAGPLASDALAESLKTLTGEEYLNFYDALSPIVDAESVDLERGYWADRHGWEPEAYLNLPMTEEEYRRFWEALVSAETYEPHLEEDRRYFEGCLPIEVMARRGFETLLYGPLRPSGLPDPRTGKEPFAVVQLRPENAERTAFSLVGFQTQLKHSEQRRVFRLIPGLERARFLRYGAVHRNTYVNAPRVLTQTLQLKAEPRVLLAGQIAGTEGYLEAAAGGLAAGVFAWMLLERGKASPFPKHTTIGALLYRLAHGNPRHFEPVSAVMSIFTEVPEGLRRKERRQFIRERALKELREFAESLGVEL